MRFIGVLVIRMIQKTQRTTIPIGLSRGSRFWGNSHAWGRDRLFYVSIIVAGLVLTY